MKSPTKLQRVAGRLLGMVPVAQLMKDRRSTIMMRTDLDPANVAKILVPDWNYNRLLDLAETSWVLGMVYDAIIREALSPGYAKEPRFIKKCVNDKCGKEFQSAVATCDACGSAVRDPNAEQGQRLETLMRDPNPDQELDAILKSVMWQSLAVDDWFLSIVYRNLGTIPSQDIATTPPGTQVVQALRVAQEVWVEDSANIRIVADRRGRLGNDQWFCPKCYGQNGSDEFWGEEQVVCPHDQVTLLQQTAYVQVIEDQITARFSKDEIVHGNSGKNLPRLFGKPRLIRLLRLILTLQYMDRYNLAAYSSGNLKGILSFPKMDQKAVEELELSVESQLATFQQDKETGERTRPNRMLWLGTAELPSFLNTMPPSKDMQSLDWYKFYRESIAAVYSVTPVFVSIVESGRTGNNPAMQIDVQNRATAEWQQAFEEPWNNQVLPAFGITDWQFKFNDVNREDIEQDAKVQLLHAQAANVFAAAGFSVTIDEDGNIEVSGQATRPVAGAGTAVQGLTTPVTNPSTLSEKESVFVTGDGPCPWCGMPVIGDDPSTHHTHNLSKMAPPLPAAGHGSGGGQGAHHSGAGKRRQVSLLKQAMPQEYDTYVEPFAGSASLFFALDPPPGKSVLNDIDPEFAEVWNWIKTATSEQVQDLQGRKWTATRDEFFAAKAFEPKTATDQIWKNVYVARFSFRRNRRSWRGSDASTITGMPDWLQNIDKYRKQLENAEVTVGDWKQTVKVRDSPTTFFYIDPPYDDQFVKDLLEVLPTIKGKWLLSFGYHPDLQEGLAKAGFNPRTVTVSNMLHGGASPVANLQRQELIAANYPLQLTEKDLIIKSEAPRKRYVIDEYS